jgi:hypothetical protein
LLVLTHARVRLCQRATAFQVLDDVASLRQGLAAIVANADSVDYAFQTIATLTQQQACNL